MAQFQVPQFIDTESKIVGPLTLKQFAYLGVAGLLSFFLFFILKTFVWVFFTAIIVLLALGFAFFRYNGRSLASILKSAFLYYWNPRLYLWKRADTTANLPSYTAPSLKSLQNPGGESKIKNLWLGLITKKPPVKPGA